MSTPRETSAPKMMNEISNELEALSLSDEIPKGCVSQQLNDSPATRKTPVGSSTVEIDNVPHRHAPRFVKSMCVEVFGEFEDIDYESEELKPDINPTMRITDTCALVRFKNPENAARFVGLMNAAFWKSRTVFCRCVPDAALDDMLAPKRKREEGEGKTVKLFVTGMRLTEIEVHQVFQPFELNDVSIPATGGFAFAFLGEKDAMAAMGQFPKKFKGRTIHVTDKKKKKGDAGK